MLAIICTVYLDLSGVLCYDLYDLVKRALEDYFKRDEEARRPYDLGEDLFGKF